MQGLLLRLQDVRCEYGFERNRQGTACELQQQEHFNLTCATSLNDRHWRSTGDALVANDQCTHARAPSLSPIQAFCLFY